jgi:hypothetical protein
MLGSVNWRSAVNVKIQMDSRLRAVDVRLGHSSAADDR